MSPRETFGTRQVGFELSEDEAKILSEATKLAIMKNKVLEKDHPILSDLAMMPGLSRILWDRTETNSLALMPQLLETYAGELVLVFKEARRAEADLATLMAGQFQEEFEKTELWRELEEVLHES